jgi:hypothetical protein
LIEQPQWKRQADADNAQLNRPHEQIIAQLQMTEHSCQ